MSESDQRRRTSADGPARVDVLGVGISCLTLDSAVEEVSGWVDRGEHRYVCITGVHGVMESQADEGLRHVHNAAGLVTPDGMPMVWLSQYHGHRHTSRVYGPDLMLAVCERSLSRPGYRHFFYGGNEGVPERLASRLQKRFPGLHVAGTYSPPFRAMTPEEDDRLVRMINETNPDIVWVGLSTPKQEQWMSQHVRRLGAPVLVGVGAAFDFHAGLKRQAPRWMQRSGLEWLYRLGREPRRLGRRYLRNNPAFVLDILARPPRLAQSTPGPSGTVGSGVTTGART